jgi:uncharacterized tellurite resistance protein B-like protein
MAGFLDQFRKKVVSSVWKDKPDGPQVKDINDKIALGVLLWVVAEADERFLAEEEEKIKEILFSYGKIPEEDIPYVMSSIQEAAKERIGLERFTHEVSKDLEYKVKTSIIETLFRIACADKELDNKEHEVIRKISGLFGLAHEDFINAKIKIKRELGLQNG